MISQQKYISVLLNFPSSFKKKDGLLSFHAQTARNSLRHAVWEGPKCKEFLNLASEPRRNGLPFGTRPNNIIGQPVL
ncbi:hypothetical protein NC653_001216 [Populus alba x Populus x berolinensis]|uniref:Uncharacterized protein n=1 Tax=Populus alba x Populus x berolinensis TaxID=444605 RepID=A0AAD6WG84_9ROSI|nr:hypothetical protein NC653_001216 [Populus alba x Populus x berolinensis]